MTAGKIIAYIAAGILIFFGVLFIWGAFSPDGSPSWILIGLISVGIGFGLIWLGSRAAKQAAGENVTLKVELPGKMGLDTLKCQSCGGVLSSDNIKMVNNAPMVSCPYCKSTYQLVEEPKW